MSTGSVGTDGNGRNPGAWTLVGGREADEPRATAGGFGVRQAPCSHLLVEAVCDGRIGLREHGKRSAPDRQRQFRLGRVDDFGLSEMTDPAMRPLD